MTLDDLLKKRLKQRCFYTKLEILKILTEISLKIEVNELPDTGVENYLYLIPSQVQEGYYLQYIWKDGQWLYLGESEVDLTDYVTDLELEMGLNTKQDTLVSGTNIKTVDGLSLLGSGDVKTIMDVSIGIPLGGGGYTLSKTFTEIKTALDNGIDVRIVISGDITLYLNNYNASRAVFTGFKYTNNRWLVLEVTVTDTNSVTLTERYLQSELISGTDIKTINQQTLLNSGDLLLLPKTVTASTIPDTGALPNVCYNLGTTDTVTITLAAGESGVANVYLFTFTAQSSSCSVTLPNSVELASEYSWDFQADRYFEVTIMNNVASVIYCDPNSNS